MATPTSSKSSSWPDDPEVDPLTRSFSDPYFDCDPFEGRPWQYIIASSPRVASTLLSRLLWQSGRLGVPHEYFYWRKYMPPLADHLGVPCPTLQHYNSDAVLRYWRALERHRTTGNGVFGMKTHFFQIHPLMQAQDLANIWYPQKVIRMTRVDMVAQAVSFAIAKQTNRFHSFEQATGEPVYDAELITECLQLIIKDNRGWDRLLGANAIATHQVTYEDLRNDPKTTVQGVFDYLECNMPPKILNEALGISPVTQGASDDWVKRYRDESLDPSWKLG